MMLCFAQIKICLISHLLGGRPELRTFSTYEITSQTKQGEGFLSRNKTVHCLIRRVREGSKSYETLSHKW